MKMLTLIPGQTLPSVKHFFCRLEERCKNLGDCFWCLIGFVTCAISSCSAVDHGNIHANLEQMGAKDMKNDGTQVTLIIRTLRTVRPTQRRSNVNLRGTIAQLDRTQIQKLACGVQHTQVQKRVNAHTRRAKCYKGNSACMEDQDYLGTAR